MSRIGVLLTNIGTPDEPQPEAVGRYLRQFLMDDYVLDMAFLKRWLLVNRVIVPRRKHYSAEHYQKIQMEEGSPLLVHTQRFAASLRTELSDDTNEYVVEIGMRYGNPSISAALRNLKNAGVDRIVAAPLYPQYCAATTATANDAVFAALLAMRVQPALRTLPPYYDDPLYIDALRALTRASTEMTIGEMRQRIARGEHRVTDDDEEGKRTLHSLQRVGEPWVCT